MSTQQSIVPARAGLPEFTHREILEVLWGLMIAMFVANISGTIVSNALPTIASHLGSDQQGYTWIVTATLLASTATTPIWGKLADMFDKKRLITIGLLIFAAGSLLAGAAASTGWLIAARAVQGVGLGAVMSLVQAILGTIIPPRNRGRYMAYTGAVTAVATVLGPLAGGWIVDQPWLGWRWCFWLAVPLAVVAIVVLVRRLRVPHFVRDDLTVDWLGSTLITLAASSLLIWISFAGTEFAWASWQTVALVALAVVSAVAFVFVELRVKNPIIPMNILTTRTTALASIASIAVGVGMFGASVFLGQYFQIARQYSPTEAGLMTVPMMAGVMLSSLYIGRLVSRVGVWKPFVLAGAIILAAGFTLMSTIRIDTPLWQLGVFMLITGLGVGMTMQNLVLAVQNSVPVQDVGSASSTVTFFRSLGGALGIQVLGVVFAGHVRQAMAEPLKAAVAQLIASHQLTQAQAQQLLASQGAGGSLNFDAMPAQIAAVVREAYGNSVGSLFLIGAVITVISVVAVAFMKGTRLRSRFDDALPAEGREEYPVSGEPALARA
ncbi:MAG: MDR family MFS transporter [Propionicimonas sp.]|nr:MDR family MFS transporter [Propionicimonas sp.]